MAIPATKSTQSPKLKGEKINLYKPLLQQASNPGCWRDRCTRYHYTIAPSICYSLAESLEYAPHALIIDNFKCLNDERRTYSYVYILLHACTLLYSHTMEQYIDETLELCAKVCGHQLMHAYIDSKLEQGLKYHRTSF